MPQGFLMHTACEPVLILAPFGRDGQMLEQTMRGAGVAALRCDTITQLRRPMQTGAGGLLLTEEALGPRAIEELLRLLDDQPAWSDLPLLVLVGGAGRGDRSDDLARALGERTNATYLERPVHRTMLLSAVSSALRARGRQYEARDLIEAHAASEAREHEARADAEAAIAMRDEFLGLASHELRTPLT
ncbi:MAG: hypothetical protein WCI61_06250, partial [Chloroflexota bacterium]